MCVIRYDVGKEIGDGKPGPVAPDTEPMQWIWNEVLSPSEAQTHLHMFDHLQPKHLN
jgi:hypothetical protein